MRKFLFSVVLLSSISLLSASSVDKNSNQIFSLGDGFSALQTGTTALFTISITSINTTGTTTGRWTMYKTSATLEQLNTGGGATTNYFNVLLSTSDSIFDIINRGNEITNWTFTISPGCYGLQLATGTASVRNATEGASDGIQWSSGGKSVSFSTGSANAITIYSNGTLYLSKYFEPVDYQEYAVRGIYANLSQGTTMYIYEGVTSTITTTLVDMPRTQLNVFEYPTGLPLPISSHQAFEFQVKYGTWTINTGDTINRSQILYYKFKN